MSLDLLKEIYALPLPLDLIRYINRFVFMDKYTGHLKRLKKDITETIKTTYYSGANFINFVELFGEREFLFWINDDYRCPQFQSTFCRKCGDYVCHNTLFTEESEKTGCRCVILN